MTDVWAAPASVVPAPRPSRWREDATAFVGIVVASVLLGAPAGLLWAAVAPRVRVTFTADGPTVDNIESTKAFVGADGSYLLVMVGLGVLCGVLAWVFARRSGPWTVLALVLGGVLAALIAASVGLQPHSKEALAALRSKDTTQGSVELFLGRRGKDDDLSLRAPWAAVGWPVGALVAFLVPAFQRPEELD
jgi:hypothetical protein